MSHVNVTTKVDQKTYRMVKVVAGFTDQTMSEFIADVVKRAVDEFDYEQAILENTVYHDTDSMVDNDSDSDDDREVDNDNDNDNDNGSDHDTDNEVENSHGGF